MDDTVAWDTTGGKWDSSGTQWEHEDSFTSVARGHGEANERMATYVYSIDPTSLNDALEIALKFHNFKEGFKIRNAGKLNCFKTNSIKFQKNCKSVIDTGNITLELTSEKIAHKKRFRFHKCLNCGRRHHSITSCPSNE